MLSIINLNKTRRAMAAATPTPSVDNIESIAVDDDCVQLGYHYRGTKEEIIGEQDKNAWYEGIMGTREFHLHRSASWKACQSGSSIVGPGQC